MANPILGVGAISAGQNPPPAGRHQSFAENSAGLTQLVYSELHKARSRGSARRTATVRGTAVLGTRPSSKEGSSRPRSASAGNPNGTTSAVPGGLKLERDSNEQIVVPTASTGMAELGRYRSEMFAEKVARETESMLRAQEELDARQLEWLTSRKAELAVLQSSLASAEHLLLQRERSLSPAVRGVVSTRRVVCYHPEYGSEGSSEEGEEQSEWSDEGSRSERSEESEESADEEEAEQQEEPAAPLEPTPATVGPFADVLSEWRIRNSAPAPAPPPAPAPAAPASAPAPAVAASRGLQPKLRDALCAALRGLKSSPMVLARRTLCQELAEFESNLRDPDVEHTMQLCAQGMSGALGGEQLRKAVFETREVVQRMMREDRDVDGMAVQHMLERMEALTVHPAEAPALGPVLLPAVSQYKEILAKCAQWEQMLQGNPSRQQLCEHATEAQQLAAQLRLQDPEQADRVAQLAWRLVGQLSEASHQHLLEIDPAEPPVPTEEQLQHDPHRKPSLDQQRLRERLEKRSKKLRGAGTVGRVGDTSGGWLQEKLSEEDHQECTADKSKVQELDPPLASLQDMVKELPAEELVEEFSGGCMSGGSGGKESVQDDSQEILKECTAEHPEAQDELVEEFKVRYEEHERSLDHEALRSGEDASTSFSEESGEEDPGLAQGSSEEDETSSAGRAGSASGPAKYQGMSGGSMSGGSGGKGMSGGSRGGGSRGKGMSGGSKGKGMSGGSRGSSKGKGMSGGSGGKGMSGGSGASTEDRAIEQGSGAAGRMMMAKVASFSTEDGDSEHLGDSTVMSRAASFSTEDGELAPIASQSNTNLGAAPAAHVSPDIQARQRDSPCYAEQLSRTEGFSVEKDRHGGTRFDRQVLRGVFSRFLDMVHAGAWMTSFTDDVANSDLDSQLKQDQTDTEPVFGKRWWQQWLSLGGRPELGPVTKAGADNDEPGLQWVELSVSFQHGEWEMLLNVWFEDGRIDLIEPQECSVPPKDALQCLRAGVDDQLGVLIRSTIHAHGMEHNWIAPTSRSTRPETPDPVEQQALEQIAQLGQGLAGDIKKGAKHVVDAQVGHMGKFIANNRWDLLPRDILQCTVTVSGQCHPPKRARAEYKLASSEYLLWWVATDACPAEARIYKDTFLSNSNQWELYAPGDVVPDSMLGLGPTSMQKISESEPHFDGNFRRRLDCEHNSGAFACTALYEKIIWHEGLPTDASNARAAAHDEHFKLVTHGGHPKERVELARPASISEILEGLRRGPSYQKLSRGLHAVVLVCLPDAPLDDDGARREGSSWAEVIESLKEDHSRRREARSS